MSEKVKLKGKNGEVASVFVGTQEYKAVDGVLTVSAEHAEKLLQLTNYFEIVQESAPAKTAKK